MAELWIANTVTDLIQGDVREHLPLESIPLKGDVLGLGTTTSIDNGELIFREPAGGSTSIWMGEASSGGIRHLRPGDGCGHFPYVCFSGDVSAERTPLDPALLGAVAGRPLQDLVGAAITLLGAQGRLAPAPIYGLRAVLRWESLVITVASKLCMGQRRRNVSVARSAGAEAAAGCSLYQQLQHYRLAVQDPGEPEDPIRYLGRSLQWECCGFYDTVPQTGRVTVPQSGAHLHLHGCSTDLRFGGHLHHEHGETRLERIERLVLYPLHTIHALASDLAVEQLRYADGSLSFRVVNRGALDVSDVGVAVVVDDRYGSHRYLRLPWLAAGEEERFSLELDLGPGRHRLEVIADPHQEILESPDLRSNNRLVLELVR